MRRERRLLVSTGMSCTFTLLFNAAPGSIMLLATSLDNAALFETMANLVSKPFNLWGSHNLRKPFYSKSSNKPPPRISPSPPQ